MNESIVALALAGIVGRPIVWGIVVICLAKLGTRHPKHKDYFIQLAESKEPGITDITLGRFGNIGRRSNNGKID